MVHLSWMRKSVRCRSVSVHSGGQSRAAAFLFPRRHLSAIKPMFSRQVGTIYPVARSNKLLGARIAVAEATGGAVCRFLRVR